MSNLERATLRALAARNGGPGLTAAELAEQLGASLPIMRHALATLVFTRREATCHADGRYVLGDPSRLIEMKR